VRDRAVVAPPGPYVAHACATALRRSCSNRVAGTARPRKHLCRAVSSSVNNESETGRACLHSHLNARRRRCSWGWRWARSGCGCWSSALRRCTHLNRIGAFPTCVGAAGVGGGHCIVIGGSVDKSGIDNAGPARAGKRFIRTAVDHRSLHVVPVCPNGRRPRKRDLSIAGIGSQARRGRQIDEQGR
jgi:hypothetical protein